MSDALLELLFSDASQREKAIALLFVMRSGAAPKQIKDYAASIGFHGSEDWNIPALFGRSKGQAVSKGGLWHLTRKGEQVAESLGLSRMSVESNTAFQALEMSVSKLSSADTRSFLREALSCLRSGSLRAAIIMSWVAAAHTLQDHVVTHHLSVFNNEALRRDNRWRAARSTDDLARMKESDFLDVLDAIGVLQRNVKTEIKGCLDRRNACGHPNSYQLSELTAAHHVDVLTINVFAKFSSGEAGEQL